MVTVETFRQIALSFPGVVELPHFERTSFRINLPGRQAGKKIFATLAEKDKPAMVKLSLVDQSVFCAYDKAVIYPVPGGWGKGGATYINLEKIKKSMLKDALTCAYQNITARQQ
jgi:hypothetical protein